MKWLLARLGLNRISPATIPVFIVTGGGVLVALSLTPLPATAPAWLVVVYWAVFPVSVVTFAWGVLYLAALLVQWTSMAIGYRRGFAELLGVPSRTVWEGDRSIGRSALFIIAISLIGSAAARIRVLEGRAIAARRAAAQAQTLRAMEDGCRFLLSEVSQRSKIDPLALGVSVWRAGLDDELQRVQRHRFASRQASGVRWTKGKGAIGRCWLDNNWLVADLTPLHDPALTKESFGDVPDAVRLDMSWDESRQSASYRAVWAEPLRDKLGKWIGCLSVDSEAPGSAQTLKMKVRPNATVLGLVETIATSLVAIVELEKT